MRAGGPVERPSGRRAARTTAPAAHSAVNGVAHQAMVGAESAIGPSRSPPIPFSRFFSQCGAMGHLPDGRVRAFFEHDGTEEVDMSNRAVAEKYFQAITRGDIEGALACFAK